MSARSRKAGVCVCCSRPGDINGRGLVDACYARWTRAGRLHEFPLTRGQVRDTLLDRWQRIAGNPPIGLRTAEIARMLGITCGALQRALARARRDGDPRAVYLPHPFTGVRYDPQAATDRYGQRRKSKRKGGES